MIGWLRPLIAAGLLIAAALPAAAAQDCSPAGIAKARAAFKQAYDKKDFDGADAIMTPLWNDCVADKDVDPVLRAWLSTDTAILAHRRGNDDECLQALLEYIPPGPALAKFPANLQQAIRFNYGLCKPYCDRYGGPSASCESLRADKQLEKLVDGHFAEKPCPFDTGGSPTVVLPDGRCLTVFAPAAWHRAEDEEDDPAHEDPEKVCPRVDVARMTDGKLNLTPLTVPKQSLLRSLDVCCDAINLATNSSGQIEITPTENPPENCISGHRWDAQQDILVVRGDRLSLVHRLNFQ